MPWGCAVALDLDVLTVQVFFSMRLRCPSDLQLLFAKMRHLKPISGVSAMR